MLSEVWKETEGSNAYLLGKAIDTRRPPPRLLWGTSDVFFQKSENVLRFLEESLQLDLIEDWRLQRVAFRELIRAFFFGRRGTAWISTIPYKPYSGTTLSDISTDGADARHRPQLKQERLVKRLERYGRPTLEGRVRHQAADFDADLPAVPLENFLFSYGKSDRVEQGSWLFREARRNHLVSAGLDLRGDDLSYYLATLDDRKLMWESGPVTTARDYSDDKQAIFLLPHIRLCRLPRRSQEFASSIDTTTQMLIVLRPDGRVASFIKSRRSMLAYLCQQELDYQMLRAAGAIRD